MSKLDAIVPGSTIAILGDGQLARMLAIAAARLGFKVLVVGPGGRESPAGHVAYKAIAWGQNGEVGEELLDKICTCAVCLIEWENVPIALVERIEARGTPVRPGSNILRIAQDRLLEKRMAEKLGIPVGPYRNIEHVHEDIPSGSDTARKDSILKSRRNGYDGLHRAVVRSGSSITEAWRSLNYEPCILEEMIKFKCELSVIVFRSPSAANLFSPTAIAYGPFENEHERGILQTTRYPARPLIPDELFSQAANTAVSHAHTIAKELDLYGIVTTEHFLLRDGTVLFNEMAPRPHNSGHLTIDCCDTCQFEQYVRAACDLPWGSAHFHHGGEMRNIIGSDMIKLPMFLSEDVCVHIYGKGEARAGRKMGHVTKRIPLTLT